MKNIITIIFLFFSSVLFAQTNWEEVVYLKNGSIVHGIIIEQVPNEGIKVQTRDGNVFQYKYDEIEKIAKEPSKTNTRTPTQTSVLAPQIQEPASNISPTIVKKEKKDYYKIIVLPAHP